MGENESMSVRKAKAELKQLKESMGHSKPVIVWVEAYRGQTREQALERHGIDKWREGIIFIDEASEWDKYL
jgi:hypothetical protein